MADRSEDGGGYAPAPKAEQRAHGYFEDLERRAPRSIPHPTYHSDFVAIEEAPPKRGPDALCPPGSNRVHGPLA
jgi:hypothetical protein